MFLGCDGARTCILDVTSKLHSSTTESKQDGVLNPLAGVKMCNGLSYYHLPPVILSLIYSSAAVPIGVDRSGGYQFSV